LPICFWNDSSVAIDAGSAGNRLPIDLASSPAGAGRRSRFHLSNSERFYAGSRRIV
jgi:hypothetical protein